MPKKIIFLILLLIILSCEDKILVDEDTAKCIGENSKLYLANGCIACSKQEEMFGENFKYLNTMDCKAEAEKCGEAGIIAVPTWIINERQYRGVQSIERLKNLCGC